MSVKGRHHYFIIFSIDTVTSDSTVFFVSFRLLKKHPESKTPEVIVRALPLPVSELESQKTWLVLFSCANEEHVKAPKETLNIVEEERRQHSFTLPGAPRPPTGSATRGRKTQRLAAKTTHLGPGLLRRFRDTSSCRLARHGEFHGRSHAVACEAEDGRKPHFRRHLIPAQGPWWPRACQRPKDFIRIRL